MNKTEHIGDQLIQPNATTVTGYGFPNNPTTTSTVNLVPLRETKIESVTLVDGKIEIVHRHLSNLYYAANGDYSVLDSVWKDIYGVVDGEIKLVDRV